MKNMKENIATVIVCALIFIGASVLAAAFICAIYFAALLWVPEAHADVYVVGGFGKSALKENQTDNLWHQTGFGHVAAEDSNTWKLGVGLRLNHYLAVELDYRDLGQYNSHALYVSDMGAPGSYNPRTRTCIGPCEASSSSWQHGVTQGVGLSAVVAPDWEIAPFLRGGLFYHHSQFFSSQVSGFMPHQTQLSVMTHNAESSADESFTHNGLGPMFGAGLRMGRMFELEYTYFPKAGGPISPYRDISTVMLAYKIGF